MDASVEQYADTHDCICPKKMKHPIIDRSIGTRRQNFSGTVISCAKSDWRIMFAVLMPAVLDGIITRVCLFVRCVHVYMNPVIYIYIKIYICMCSLA